ncbi:transcriptional regulator [Croceibacterium sp. LX-88]|uniref:Transcriptional regulator n=1 Tax=Croceibacterium selenioxidans TaxID=2838833 RepID=A0ABS5W898_9SPHN|nr:transcriptional regulator [Croceibacterium selenioxidans]MBT2135297.1 transcriptional regulator [Croceibacterium selenioxidans]
MGEADDRVAGTYLFDEFQLEPRNRRLARKGVPVEINARYLDALALLVREHGQLVSKDRFLDEVWRGIPVTDEALTQCIKTLRRHLGDDAAAPRFVETVPKHGYRFIAAVEWTDGAASGFSASPSVNAWLEWLPFGAAGTLGGAFAGLIGGLFYGLSGTSTPLQPGMGATSVLLVLTTLTVVIAVLGAAGVSFGMAAAGYASGSPWRWAPAGGALGGLLVGAIVKLLGLDAFNLLFGQSPGNITGAPEGLLLGGAVGVGAWLAGRSRQPGLRQGAGIAALTGGLAGVLITLLGGHMMGGSLDLLARSLPDSRLTLDPIGSLFGEHGFGPVSHAVTGGLEGALFGGCVVGAMILAHRALAES